ncbi:MAG TPA: histidine phosphatase family protein [Leeuwenhoekiella sp.]|nr:histidine phosphatase family protein [Leeuwenhoekiella sp.]
MKKITAIFMLFFTAVSCQNDVKQGTTTYYLIRHAEKQSGNDPILTEKGRERSSFWAQYFKNKSLEAIYSTDTKRTMATAKLTAKEFDLKINTYDAAAMYDTDFKEKTTGKTVLIVGHSNTTPEFVNEIIAEKRYQHIDDNEFGTVFKVILNENGNAKVEKETINSWDMP